MRLIELSLRKIRKQAVVPAVAVDDQNLLATIAGHLVGGLLQQGHLHTATVSYGTGFVLGFCDLTKIVFREHDRVFLLRGMECGIAHVEQVGAEREMRAVLLENSEGKKADSG